MDYSCDSTGDPGSPGDPLTSDTDIQMNSETSEEKFLDLVTVDEEETKTEIYSPEEENRDVESSQVEQEPVTTLSTITQEQSASSVHFAKQEEKQPEQDPNEQQQEETTQDESSNSSETLSPGELENYHTCRSEEEVLPLLSHDDFQKKLYREWKGERNDNAQSGEPSVFKVLYEKYQARYENNDILPQDTYSFFVFAQYWWFRTYLKTKDLPLAAPKVTIKRRTLFNFGKGCCEPGWWYPRHWCKSGRCCYPSFGNSMFWLPFVVFLCQGGLLLLLFNSGDLRYLGDEGVYTNPGPPERLGWALRFSQFLALAISVAQQEEVLFSLNSIALYEKHMRRYEVSRLESWVFWRDREAPADTTDDQSYTTDISNISEEQRRLVSRNCVGPKNDNLLKTFFDDYISKEKYKHRYCMEVGWWFAIGSRMALGLFALFTTLSLILTEESVRDILLNFTAIQFISTVDNSIFQLASWGYLGKDLKEIAGLVEDTKYEVINESEEDNNSDEENEICCCFKWSRKVIPLFLIFLVIFSQWVVVVVNEEKGGYFCQTLFVQFGDENSPELASFTGYFDFELGSLLRNRKYRRPVDGRPLYWARDGTRTAKFGYDKKTDAWSFAYSDNNEKLPLESEKTNWVVQSVDQSQAYNLLDVAGNEWVSKIDANSKKTSSLPMQYLRMECVCADEKCDRKNNCKNNNHCFNGGTCTKDDMCECAKGWWGPNCKLRYPCDTLDIDPQFDTFIDDRQWSKTFVNIFDEALVSYNTTTIKTSANFPVYGRPVFVGTRIDRDHIDLIFFTGRRWILTSTEFLYDFRASRKDSVDAFQIKIPHAFNETKVRSVANYLVNDFHAYRSQYRAGFVSQPMDITSILNAASPENLGWYHAKRVMNNEKSVVQYDSNRPSRAVLLCVTCDKDTNPCFYDNTCNNGKCECTNTSSSGALCQIAPSGNGVCDPHFNVNEFAYDGGDCCEASCVHSKCPKKGGINYPNCVDPEWECEDPAVVCFKENINEIFGECAGGESGRSIALSDNAGKALYLAVGEPGCDGVRVFDTTFREQRGQWIKGPLHSSFGDSVALSGNGSVLAIGAPENHGGNGTVWIYNWIEEHQEWVVGFQRSGEERNSRFGETLDLTNEGDKLVVASNMKIIVYTLTEATTKNLMPKEITLEGTVQKGKALSISSDASYIAVATTIHGQNSIQIYKTDNETYSKFGEKLGNRSSVVISGDGQVMAASSSTQTFAYYRQKDSYSWERINVKDADGIISNSSVAKSPVALSEKGTTLVVDTESDNTDNPEFLVYLLQRPNRKRALMQANSELEFAALDTDNTIPSGNGSYAALSYIETGEIVIAVGYPQANNTKGKTRTYVPQVGKNLNYTIEIERRAPPVLCQDMREPVSLEIAITTDDQPEKINWILTDTNNMTLLEGGPYENKENVEREAKQLCQETSRRLRLVENNRRMLAESDCSKSCWTFTIYHAPSNGTNPVGRYEVKWNGNVAAVGKFSNKAFETKCICDPTDSEPPQISPSNPPTKNDLSSPSLLPSVFPSMLPSASPILSPSDTPSDLPSDLPSDSPSDSPSDLPTYLPTNMPSDLPTYLPTNMPSDLPTYLPTNRPSDLPTYLPTNMPSDSPSDLPTDLPTVSSSEKPSGSPSVVPSSSPTFVCKQSRKNSLVNILMLNNETLDGGDCIQVSINITLSQESNGRLVLMDKNTLLWSSTGLCGSKENNATYRTDLQNDGNWITWEMQCLSSPLADQKRDLCVAWKSGKNDEIMNDNHFVKVDGGTVQIMRGVAPNGSMVHWDSSDPGYTNPSIFSNGNC